MRILFVSKKGGILAAVYVFVFCLLACGTGIIMPDSEVIGATAYKDIPQPWYCGDPAKKQVSLAINVDWGEEYLPDMLDIMAQNDVHATFFLSGRWCGNNVHLAKEIALRGHEIGNHGYSHSSPNAATPQEIADEIQRTENAILLATGICTDLYAPPSGEREDHVLETAAAEGYQTILWSVDTIDWQQPEADTLLHRVEEKIHAGAIILAHPTAVTAETLNTLIADIKEEGYEFVTVSENIGL